MKRRLIVWLLAACAACCPAVLHAQTTAEPLRLRRDINGDSRLVTLDAEQINTWSDKGGRIVVLRGKVLVQQEGIRARCQEGVVWIETLPSGVKRITFCGEGNVRLENGPDVSEGASLVLELTTRGDNLRFNAKPGPISQTPLVNDPLLLRAVQLRSTPPPPAPASASPIPTQTIEVSKLPPLQRTRYEEKPPDSPGPRTIGTPTQILGPAVPPEVPPPGEAPPLTPGPGTPPPLPPPPSVTPGPRIAPVIEAPSRRFSVSPRSATGFNISSPRTDPADGGRQTIVITGGAIVNVRSAPNVGLVDIEADRVVIWTRGVNAQQLLNNIRTPDGEAGQELEFYLAGNVEIRQKGLKDDRILRADEVYYDVNRNVALALNSQIEFKLPQIPDPVVFKAEEIIQRAAHQYEIVRGEVFSSKLPSDPGLQVYVARATIEDRVVPRLSPFGRRVINRETGAPEDDRELYFRGRNVFFELEDVPFFYSPYLAGDLLDPLGPIEDVTFGYNRIFGLQTGITLNVYDLLGVQPYQGTKWRLTLDYLGARGPAIGSAFDYGGKGLFSLKDQYEGTLSGYAIYDDGFDVLGGGRNSDLNIPLWRGRALWRQGIYDLPYGFSTQSQVSYLSDRNFLEQFFWREFALDVNQETYVYVKQQQDYWAWTAILEARMARDWITETERLPEIEGHLINVSLFDRFTYNAHASAGYYQLRPTNDLGQPPITITDAYTRTGRFDFMQELNLPFTAGAFRVVPYGKLDLTSYTQELNNEAVGRVWGGGGARASIPFTRLYPNVQSELWNLDGINHKMVFGGNYFYAATTDPYNRFPQLDRLNDDATDQALRDIRPMYTQWVLPGNKGALLATSPLYDPQLYAIRRLVDNRIDTLDRINVLQLDLRQRWQTKRGYPGNQHIVDWMVLDVSGSYFANSTRDNFGENLAFLEYDYLWNVGDRTAITASGWFDPIDNGAKVWTVGAFLNRPDRTNFYLGYRHIDPLESRAMTAAVTYIFSPKYAMTASSTYDFGTQQAMSNQLVFTRMGTDLQMSLGVNYNALQNNFGVLFEIVPNLVPMNRRYGAVNTTGAGGLFGSR